VPAQPLLSQQRAFADVPGVLQAAEIGNPFEPPGYAEGERLPLSPSQQRSKEALGQEPVPPEATPQGRAQPLVDALNRQRVLAAIRRGRNI
jgi:hypothetical protein